MKEHYPDFLGSEIKSCAVNKAAFSVLPVPYERSVSYGAGTGLGPKHILDASFQLETWDGYSNPSEKGIHTCHPVNCEGDDGIVLERISAEVANILRAGSIPVVLGGEHTVTYGNILGLIAAGVTDFGVVQFDAHADLREAYENNPYSHASVMRRVIEKGIPVYQLGVRALCEEEVEVRRAQKIGYIDGEELAASSIQQIQLPDNFPKRVFVTVDIDGLDPSVFPSTGTPVPGGIGWYQCLNLFQSIARQREIIGFDVVEFAPIENFHAYDFAAAMLVYKLMGITLRVGDMGSTDCMD